MGKEHNKGQKPEKLRAQGMADPLDELFVQFGKEKSQRGKERIDSEIVRVATEENYQVLPVLRAIDFGTQVFVRGKDRLNGARILDGIEAYFQKMRISFKIFAPDEFDDEQANTIFEKASKVQKSIEAKRAIMKSNGFPLGLAVSGFLTETSQRFGESHSSGIVLTTANGGLHNVVSMDDILEVKSWVDVLCVGEGAVSQFMDGKSDESLQNIPDLTLERIKGTKIHHGRYLSNAALAARLRTTQGVQTSASDLGGLEPRPKLALPDIENTPYGGVTFGELLAEKDTDDFLNKSLRYLAGIPKSDFFWQSLAWGSLLAYVRDLSWDEEKSELSEFSLKLNKWQERLTEWMIIPAFIESPEGRTNPQFDSLFKAALSNLDKKNVFAMGTIIALSTIENPDRLLTFDSYEEFRDNALSGKHPLSTQAIVEILKLPDDQGVEIEDSGYLLLKNNWGMIKENWRLRFGSDPKVSQLIKFAEDTFNKGDFPGIQSRAYMEFLEEFAGKSYIERLDSEYDAAHDLAENPALQLGEEIVKTCDRMETGQRVTYTFPEKSFPRSKLGFYDIKFLKSQKRTAFVLTGPKGINVRGLISPEGRVTNRFAEMEDHKGIAFSLECLVLTSYCDLLFSKGEAGSEPFVLSQMKRVMSLGGSQIDPSSSEEIEKTASAFLKGMGNLTYRMLKELGWKDLAQAIEDKYPGGMRALKASLNMKKASPDSREKNERVSPEEANEWFDKLLKGENSS